jgi:hypothetical protein
LRSSKDQELTYMTQTQTPKNARITPTSAKATYELYVRDPNGWEDSCPDFESVFFNGGPSDLYIHPVDGGHEHAGSLLVSGYRRAKAKLADLCNSGDWETYVDDYSDEQIVKRPTYGMRKPSGEILIAWRVWRLSGLRSSKEPIGASKRRI